MRESQREILLARNACIEGPQLVSTHKGQPHRAYNPFRLWESILDELDALLRNIRIEESFTDQIVGLANLIHQLACRSADTALAAMILTDQRRYGVVHSVHVAILCNLVAQRLGWSDMRRTSLVCAALTMNLAMVELQATLCSQTRHALPCSTRRNTPPPQARGGHVGSSRGKRLGLASSGKRTSRSAQRAWLSIRNCPSLRRSSGHTNSRRIPAQKSALAQPERHLPRRKQQNRYLLNRTLATRTPTFQC